MEYIWCTIKPILTYWVPVSLNDLFRERDMEFIFSLAGSLLVLLTVVKMAAPRFGFLPLGGSEPTQMAIILGTALALNDLLKLVHQ
jgi:hypothetical protein